MLPDTGERYLTTPLFADVPEDMTEEEREISRSTPGCRFDVAAAGAAPAPMEAVDPAARTALEKAIHDPANPIVMFALEWCEFCWSARKLFEHYGIPCRPIAVDSVEYQQDNHGGKLRTALRERTGWVTLPQIFVGGDFVGGATDLFDECIKGRLQQRLEEQHITLREPIVNPYGFLPKWLHPRSK
ncbi:MAG TPA: glutaredoxin [Steroidobacteraceae bacterium]|nr:glutaredoxin [Steroidobacteraceae bacterium]